jgi:transposase
MDKWQADGSAERMHDDLRDRIRLAAGRTSAPTAAVIDSQSVKGSEMIGRARRGYDAGKKINGTKRHIAVDVLGLLLAVLVTAASVQDRDAAKPLLWNLRRAFPSVRLAWADGGYAGKLVTWAAAKLKPKLTLQIVKRPDDLHTFKVLPPPVGRRAHPVLDHPPPPHRPRLRAAARPPRDLHLLGHDHRHDPPPRPEPQSAGSQVI